MTSSPVIGIDFGGTSVKLAAVADGSLLTEIFRLHTQEFSHPDLLIDSIAELIEEIRQSHPDVGAIGVGVPGAVNFVTGITYNLTNVDGWSAFPLRDTLAKKTGLPTVIDNDANCMAYAEWKYGAAKGYQHAICVTLGTGVGGGLILNGNLFRGATYAAGEIGQMGINLEGVSGPYGNTGALERYIGNRQIVEMATALYQQRGQAVPDALSPKVLSSLANAGDAIAIEVWSEVARHLAYCLMNVIFLLNPEIIVVGGGVAAAGSLLFDPLRAALRACLTDECFDHLTLAPAQFGNTAGILGSSALAASLLTNEALPASS